MPTMNSASKKVKTIELIVISSGIECDSGEKRRNDKIGRVMRMVINQKPMRAAGLALRLPVYPRYKRGSSRTKRITEPVDDIN